MTPWWTKVLFLPEQGSTFAQRADRLHLSIVVPTFMVAAAVGVVGLYFLVRYHRRTESDPTPRIVAPMWLEALFVGIPLSCFLAWFAVGFYEFVGVATPPPDAMDVFVSAKQWMWKFSYPDGPSELNTLRVPAGRPVRLLITSRDVVHSFFVPDFRLKMDAVPARYTQTWFEAPKPGRHQVLCAEYCGLDHSHMRAEIEVLSEGDFEAWRARMKDEAQLTGPEVALSGAQPLIEHGRVVAASAGCFKCHTVDGSPHIGPTWLGLFGREESLINGGKVHVDEGYLTESMMEPLAKVVAGFKPVMPSFFGKLSPGDAASLVAYIKALRPERPGAVPAQEPAYVPR